MQSCFRRALDLFFSFYLRRPLILHADPLIFLPSARSQMQIDILKYKWTTFFDYFNFRVSDMTDSQIYHISTSEFLMFIRYVAEQE